MWPRPFEVGLVIARTANQSNKIDFRRHIWLSVADQVTASLVRAPWTGFESRMEVCPQDIDNTEIFLAGAGGFEPPYDGIKIRCLTTWRRPNRPLARASG
jgi:hypothetical protein